MVCSHCNGANHNAPTCQILHPDRSTPSENKAAKELMKLLAPKKEVNLFMELPRGPIYEPKKHNKPLEGLAGCKNIFKESKQVAKKTKKPIVGLADCKNIFKEPTVAHHNKGNTVCSACNTSGHNRRSCVMVCQPCTDQVARSYCFSGMSAKMAVQIADVLECSSVYEEQQ
jgi:hypothetical protein